MKLSWGEQDIPAGETHSFELGLLRAQIERSPRDWRVEYAYETHPEGASALHETKRVRAVFRETAPLLVLRPACPDRNVVAMPVDPIHIPAGERVTIYKSSPVWVQALVGDDLFELIDLPVEPLSNTWFGPNTREGELCYSSRSSARLFLEKLPMRPERIITPATFVNEGESEIVVDKVNLPLPLLSLYGATDGFWTQEVTITLRALLTEAEVDFKPAPPAHLQDAEPIASPREQQNGSSITRTLSMLFS